jgi:hypothetical protein
MQEFSCCRQLKRLKEGVRLQRQAPFIQYAGFFRVLASELRELRTRYNVVLVEHHRGFYRAYDSSTDGSPETGRIVANALRGD